MDIFTLLSSVSTVENIFYNLKVSVQFIWLHCLLSNINLDFKAIIFSIPMVSHFLFQYFSYTWVIHNCVEIFYFLFCLNSDFPIIVKNHCV